MAVGQGCCAGNQLIVGECGLSRYTPGRAARMLCAPGQGNAGRRVCSGWFPLSVPLRVVALTEAQALSCERLEMAMVITSVSRTLVPCD